MNIISNTSDWVDRNRTELKYTDKSFKLLRWVGGGLLVLIEMGIIPAPKSGWLRSCVNIMKFLGNGRIFTYLLFGIGDWPKLLKSAKEKLYSKENGKAKVKWLFSTALQSIFLRPLMIEFLVPTGGLLRFINWIRPNQKVQFLANVTNHATSFASIALGFGAVATASKKILETKTVSKESTLDMIDGITGDLVPEVLEEMGADFYGVELLIAGLRLMSTAAAFVMIRDEQKKKREEKIEQEIVEKRVLHQRAQLSSLQIGMTADSTFKRTGPPREIPLCRNCRNLQ